MQPSTRDAARAVAGGPDPGPALTALGLDEPRPVLVLVGGASGIRPALCQRLLGALECLAPALDALSAAVVDGGTAFGVMALMGRARARAGASFPLIGVAAAGTVDPATLPREALSTRLADGDEEGAGVAGRARLDPNHSHFLLVPGSDWGDEAPWIGAAALRLAGGRPTLTLVAAGGRITRLDVLLALRAGRPTVLLAGTGGTADLLADWWHGGEPPDGLALDAADRQLIQVLDLAQAAEDLPRVLASRLGV